MTSKIIQIGEHHVPLPPLPKDKAKIINIDKNREDAYWQRQELHPYFNDFNKKTKIWQKATIYDQDGVLVSLSEDDTKMVRNILIQEIHRRVHGVWMKNGDDLIWIAPDYYYTLQYCEMKDLPAKFGNFRWIQNDVMILWWYLRNIDWASALLLPKCKKSGITQIISSAFLNESTMFSGMEFGMASKEFDHVKNVAMSYYFHSFDKLPYIVKPVVGKRNLSEIIFNKPTDRVGSKNPTASNNLVGNTYLNTRVNGYKTKSNAFDGPVLKRGFIDEGPKWWESSKIDVAEMLNKNNAAVHLQTRINGKLIIPSYMPEVDDKGFRDFKEWYFKSKLSTRNKTTGRTENEMISFPLTAILSHELCFDKYGRCDQVKAYQLLWNERNQKSSLSDKQAHKRQYPLDENDMFDSGGKGTVFDNSRLSVRQREVKAMLDAGNIPFKYTHLKWKNADWESGEKSKRRPRGEFCEVLRQDLDEEDIMHARHEKAPFIFFRDMPEEYLNWSIRNDRRHELDECLRPKPNDPFVGSFDPVDYVLKKDVLDGSTNSAHGGYIHDVAMDTKFGCPISNSLIFEYFFREEDPDEDLENLIKAIIYLGGRWIIEANKKWVVTALKKEGLHWFLLLKDENGAIRPYQAGDENNLVNSTVDMINNYTMALKRWIAPPKSKGDVDYLQTMYGVQDLQQMMDFDTTDTKRFDKVVSLGYWRLGMEGYIEWLLTNWEEEEEDNGAMELAMEELLHL